MPLSIYVETSLAEMDNNLLIARDVRRSTRTQVGHSTVPPSTPPEDGKADADDDDGNEHRKQPKAKVPATKKICRKGEPLANKNPERKRQ